MGTRRTIDELLASTIARLRLVQNQVTDRDRAFIEYADILNQLLVENNAHMRAIDGRIDRLERRLERIEKRLAPSDLRRIPPAGP